jgi:hypothetical protein
MKNKLNILAILAIGIFLLPTCQKDPDLPYPEVKTGIAPKVTKDPAKDANISIFDLEGFNATVIVDLYFRDDKPKSMNLMVCMNGDPENTATVTAITSWPTSVNVTTADLINWLPGLDDVGQLKQGDRFLFYVDAVLEDGTYINGNDTLYTAYGSALANWPNASINVTYSIVCPYDQAMAVGSYYTECSDWAVAGNITITADPDDPYTVYVAGLETIDGLDEDLGPLVMHIDPATYVVTADKTVLASLVTWGAPYHNIAYEGTGTFDSCTGSYLMTFEITVDEGSFGNYVFPFTRN